MTEQQQQQDEPLQRDQQERDQREQQEQQQPDQQQQQEQQQPDHKNIEQKQSDQEHHQPDQEHHQPDQEHHQPDQEHHQPDREQQQPDQEQQRPDQEQQQPDQEKQHPDQEQHQLDQEQQQPDQEQQQHHDQREHQEQEHQQQLQEHQEEQDLEGEQEAPEFVVEKILDKKIDSEGFAKYLVKWEGFPNSENTWEPIEYLAECDKLMQQFEIDRALKLSARVNDQNDCGGKVSSDKRPRSEKRKKYEINDIMGITKLRGEKYFLVSFAHSTRKSFIRASLANKMFSGKVIDFYVRNLRWRVRLSVT